MCVYNDPPPQKMTKKKDKKSEVDSGSQLTHDEVSLYWYSETNTNLDKLAPMAAKMCSDGVIEFQGCHIAGGEQGGRFLQKAADVTGVRCTGHTVYVFAAPGGVTITPGADPGLTSKQKSPAAGHESNNCCSK